MARRSPNARSRKRVGLYWPLLVTVYLVVGARVVWLQTVAVPDIRERAAIDRKDTTELPAERGRILDRNGKVLAYNVEESKVILHPKLIRDKALAARVLAAHVGLSASEVREVLDSSKNYNVLAANLPAENAIRLRQALLDLGPGPGINGVEFEFSTRRVYPMGALGAKLLGAVNSAGKGIAGIERYADSQLRGRPGHLWADFDRNGRAIPTRMRKTVPPEPGRDVVLTIDSRIQFLAEQALERQVQKFSAQSASCIVVDPATGEILALAEYPSFDPNRLRTDDVNNLESHALTHVFEPGSTIKLFTAAGALERGVEHVSSTCTGRIQIGGHTVRCPCSVRRSEPGAPVTMERMLQYSCNTEAIALGKRIGPEALYDQMKSFGLLDAMEVPGLGLTVGGMLPDPHRYKWPDIRTATVSFGQGIATSRLNLIAAYGAVANGGLLMRPQLIREVRSLDAEQAQPFKPDIIRRVMPAHHAATLRDCLENVVENGTGKSAGIEGVEVGGKTGSAQMTAQGKRGFIPGAFITSFCGIAPMDEPRVAILVTVERPQGSTHGATVAAPVFREVGEMALWCVGEIPDSPATASRKPVAGSKVSGGPGQG